MVPWAIVGLVVVLLLAALNWGKTFYTDWLWFSSLGYQDVLVKTVTTRAWLFVAGLVTFSLFAAVNIFLAQRLTRGEASPSPVITPEAYRVLRRLLFWLALGGAVLVGLAFAASAASRWDVVLRYANAVPFDQSDPIFDKNVAFYVFNLPLVQFVRGWLLGALVVVLLLVGAMYLLVYSLQGQQMVLPRRVQVHLAALGAGIFLLIAAGHWLGRYELLFSSTGAVFGVGYADAAAGIPARLLLTGVALVTGALLLAGAFASSYRLMVGAVSLWVGLALVAGNVYPGLVQRFQVQPNELQQETPYFANNIQATRQAYGLDRITKVSHPAVGVVSAQTLDENKATVDNVRLWDEGPLLDIFNQIQIFRFYYTAFSNITTDRYEIDGQFRQVMLAAREFAAERLEPAAQTWVNQHLVYTHGYGVAMSPVTEVASDGRPEFLIKDVPLEEASGAPHVQRPEVYYGERSPLFVIAKGKTGEFDYSGTGGTTKYEGSRDVALSSFFRRLLYAWQFGDVNILISDQVQPESLIQYRRTVRERFSAVTPFLVPDRDPYLVVADGRLYWIQDAYTMTNRYPYSTPWQGQFNYMRNSVKAVVDAYEGSITYYVFDDKDPLINTYQNTFPGLFKPRTELPPALEAHIRYPRDLFSIQTQMLLQYHMEEPSVFYQKEDQWSLPFQSSFGQTNVLLEPYYIMATLPLNQSAGRAEFLLIQPFTPDRRHNLISWAAARNDPEHYGEIILFEFPKGSQIDGPNQVEARIDNDARISQQFTLWGQVGSEVSRGILLVIPVGDAILYAEPVFLRPTALPFPELRRIILADARKVVMQPNRDLAVRAMKGEIPAVALAQTEETLVQPPEVSVPPPAGTGDVQALIGSVEEAIRQLQKLLGQLKQQVQGQAN